MKLNSAQKKDLDKKYLLAAIILLSVLRILLSRSQMIFTMPKSAPIDDDLFFSWANSIVQGEWLGEYNYLTLSKYPFFAVWRAFLHIIRCPFLVGNTVLWVITGVVSLCAFYPILKSNWHRLVFYTVIIFNPSTYTAYTLRVYRDSFFPIVCTLFFTSLVGWAIRYHESISKNIPYMLIASVALGIAFISREDGYWVMPFMVCAYIIVAIYAVNDYRISNKTALLSQITLPVIFVAISVLSVCTLNYKYYGVFKISDYTSGAFADCYGAMTSFGSDNDIVDVPYQTRAMLYDSCDLFSPFKPWLEESGIKTAYMDSETGDYKSGAFYWALRRSAQEMGIYSSAEESEQFWSGLSQQIKNTYPDMKYRSSVTPPVKASYIAPVCKTALQGCVYMLTWRDISSYETSLSDITTGQIEYWQDFTYTTANFSAIENSPLPYHSPLQKIAYTILDSITLVYKILTIPAFLLSAFLTIYAFSNFKHYSKQKQILLIALLGYIAMFLFRVFIISYMEVAAFGIGLYSMYFGCCYPLMLLWFTLSHSFTQTERF